MQLNKEKKRQEIVKKITILSLKKLFDTMKCKKHKTYKGYHEWVREIKNLVKQYYTAILQIVLSMHYSSKDSNKP